MAPTTHILEEYESLGNSISQDGSYAIVFKARHKELGYIRAIKLLKSQVFTKQDDLYKQFLDECKLWLRLGNGCGHPNIVRMMKPGLEGTKAYVEMEWVEGKDLNDYIKSCNGFIEYDEIMRFMSNICSAMAYLHYDIYKACIIKDEDECVDTDDTIPINEDCEKKLVAKYRVLHNDIHSKNVIRKDDGSYVLLDFGLAIESNTVKRTANIKGGAEEYKAPEKFDLSPEDDLTEQMDIYSLGILMYEMLAGRVPFPKGNVDTPKASTELLIKHQNASPPDLYGLRKEAYTKKYNNSSFEKDYPTWLEDMILKCLEKDPGKRFKSAKELHECLLRNITDINKNKTEIITDNSAIRDLNITITQLQKEKNALIENKNNLISEISGFKKSMRTKFGNTKRTWMAAFFSLFMISACCFIYVIRNQNGADNSPSIIRVEDTSLVKTVSNKEINFNGQKFRYSGYLVNGLPEDEGIAYLDNNDIYRGNFKKGFRDGIGIYYFAIGDTLDCKFKADEAFGIGKYTFKDGSYYVGEFSNSDFNGKGILYNKDGSILTQGEFKGGNLVTPSGTRSKK